jgi:putative membrane protein
MSITHLIQLFLSAWAWRVEIGAAIPLPRMFTLRWIREGVNSLLPLAQIAGQLVAIRLLRGQGPSVALAGAATALDLTIEAIAQLIFTLLGLAILAALSAGQSGAPWIEAGLLSCLFLVIGLTLAQRLGLLKLIELAASRIGRIWPKLSITSLDGLHNELMRLQRDSNLLVRATGLHTLSWMFGAIEVWVALAAMGQQATIVQCFIIESLAMAARSAGFLVPGALGVQEAGFILACGLFSIAPDTAISLSVLKRLRELAVGLPSLIAWHRLERTREHHVRP